MPAIPERHIDTMRRLLDTDEPHEAIAYYKANGAAELSPEGMLAGWHKARLCFKHADMDRRRRSWEWLQKRNMRAMFNLPLGPSFEEYIAAVDKQQ